MSNACFRTHNPIGRRCRDVPRGHYNIPTGQPFIHIELPNNVNSKQFRVVHFKFGARFQYIVRYFAPNTWSCTCPDFAHRHRAEARNCCKHIQACIDKVTGISRGTDYNIFLNEQVFEQVEL